MYVRFGNHAAKESRSVTVLPSDPELRAKGDANPHVKTDDDPSDELLAARLSSVKEYSSLDGNYTTDIHFPDGWRVGECFQAIIAGEAASGGLTAGIWANHSNDSAPAWVESDSPALQALLAEHYGIEGESPKARQLEANYYTEYGPPGIGPKGVIAATGEEGGIMLALLTLGLFQNHLRTNAGADFQSRVMGDTASTGTGAYAAATYIGLSEGALAPAATHTFLTQDGTTVSEIFGASGTGLSRQQAAYAHTNGTTTYTLTKTFTMGASDGASRNIQKIGVFNLGVTSAPTTTSGTLVFATAVPSPPTLVQGDQITLTETVALS